MNITILLKQKANLLFVLLFFTSNWMIGQSIAETYSQSQAPGRFLNIEETSSGFEMLLEEDATQTAPIYVNVDASGNFLSVDELPNINNQYYSPLDNGNFLQRVNTDGPGAEYRLLDQNQGLISTFTIPAPSGALRLAGGALGEYSNGDFLMNFGYSGLPNSDFSILRINPFSGQIIWREEIEFGWTNGDGFALEVELTNDNESAFISVANTTNNLYFIVKMSATGTILLNEFFGTTSKIPRDFTASTDGGLWYLANAIESTIFKKNADGTDFTISTDPIFMAGTTNQELVATPDGGVMAIGQISSETYTLQLSADGTVLNSTVLDNLPIQIDLATAGTRLNSGGFIFGGRTDSNERFLMTLDQNGEFNTGGGECNVNITSSNGGVTITGLTSDANSILFDANSQEVFSCNPWDGNVCSSNETVSGLTVGATYFLSVQSSICSEWIPITIQGGGGGGGATCSDGIQNQGETGIDCGGPCAPCPSACNVNLTSSNGGVTITGLTSDANSKLFDANSQEVFSCNPWDGNVCSSNETVSGLTVGATYFLSVQSSVCSEWIPITIQGGGGGGGATCSDGIQNQGETGIDCGGPCAPCPSACNVNLTSSNGAVNITGLTSNTNSKLFDANTQEVWECNPWNGNGCSSNETVSGLTVGATYFLSVQSSVCSEWIPIVVQGGGGDGGGGGQDCDGVTANFTSNTSLLISNLSAPIVILRVYDPSWSPIYECIAGDCSETVTIPTTATSGDYIIDIQFYTNSWQQICQRRIFKASGNITAEEAPTSLLIAPSSDRSNLNYTNATKQNRATIKAFPNPVQDEVFVNVSSSLIGQKGQLIITNQFGQKVQELALANITNEPIAINTAGLKNGLHYVLLQSEEEEMAVTKVMVIR